MFRFIKRVIAFFLTLAVLAGIGRYVVVPRVIPLEYTDIVEKYAEEFDLEESLIYAVIFCESRFDAEVVSHAGAVGLMQVTADTGMWVAKHIGMDPNAIDLTDPDTNVHLGCWYLNWLDDRFHGQTLTALAAYNAGHTNVENWLSDEEKSFDGISLDQIPFPETDKYVSRVEFMEEVYIRLYHLGE